MIYLIEPTALDFRCKTVCGTNICGRLSIHPICPPNTVCPLK
jgi:hypothetical protein